MTISSTFIPFENLSIAASSIGYINLWNFFSFFRTCFLYLPNLSLDILFNFENQQNTLAIMLLRHQSIWTLCYFFFGAISESSCSCSCHCVKSICIRSYSGPHFPAFGLNTERYFVYLRIQSKCREMLTRMTLNTDTFYAMCSKNIHTGFVFTLGKRENHTELAYLWKTNGSTLLYVILCVGFLNFLKVLFPYSVFIISDIFYFLKT